MATSAAARPIRLRSDSRSAPVPAMQMASGRISAGAFDRVSTAMPQITPATISQRRSPPAARSARTAAMAASISATNSVSVSSDPPSTIIGGKTAPSAIATRAVRRPNSWNATRPSSATMAVPSSACATRAAVHRSTPSGSVAV